MTPEQISDNVKRLRELDKRSGGKAMLTAEQFQSALATINGLVELVGEMHYALNYPVSIMQADLETHLGDRCGKTMRKALAKSAPIAALKEKV